MVPTVLADFGGIFGFTEDAFFIKIRDTGDMP